MGELDVMDEMFLNSFQLAFSEYAAVNCIQAC